MHRRKIFCRPKPQTERTLNIYLLSQNQAHINMYVQTKLLPNLQKGPSTDICTHKQAHINMCKRSCCHPAVLRDGVSVANFELPDARTLHRNLQSCKKIPLRTFCPTKTSSFTTTPPLHSPPPLSAWLFSHTTQNFDDRQKSVKHEPTSMVTPTEPRSRIQQIGNIYMLARTAASCL